MEYGEGFEQSVEIASKALLAMRDNGVPANPDNFAVWYTYVSGKFPDLTKAVREIIEGPSGFTPEVNGGLFERFFGKANEAAAVEQTSAQIQDTLTRVMSMLDEAGRGTAEFGDKLEEAGGRLAEGPKDVGQLQSVLGEMLDETRRMADRNRELEGQLKDSSSEISQLRQNLEDVRREAMTDALTGIANRKFFDIALRQVASEAMETKEPMALLMMDIDFFKKFNDTYGHQLGDQVLKLVARCLTDCTKGRDTAARYGGEEFSIILPNTTLSNAVKLAEQVRLTVASKKVYKRSTNQDLGTITLSIGAAAFQPGEQLTGLIQRADEALYTAKRTGRNRVVDETHLEKVATA